MKQGISGGLLSVIKKNDTKYVVLTTSVRQYEKNYYLTLYLIGCSGGWDQAEAIGDICTKEIGTKNFIKVGEWGGVGEFIEMNIYQFGLYATSRFDPSMVVNTTKEELTHLPYINFENTEIPKNTILHRYIKTLERLYLQEPD
jgi:hypothetical protein